MNLLNKNKIPRRMWRRFTRTKLYNYIPDKWAVKIKYRNNFLKKLDLKNPQTFNEKLQWLKLYNRRPEYTTMVDKVEAKKYVASVIGDEYIIPTLGTWESFDEIDFDALPQQFVLKCTHSSGDAVVCKDKSKLDKEVAKKTLETSLNKDYYLMGREWPYKNVKRLIFAETYVEDEVTKEARDYKFFCFDGKVQALFIATDRPYDTRFDFFDTEFNHLPICNGHPNSEKTIEKPVNFDLMLKLASKLSEKIPHVRVDLYEINGRVYFGEMTFFHYSGFVPFEPASWDKTFGDYITLPQKNTK